MMLQNLSTREQTLLVILGPMLVLAIGFQFGWKPLAAERAGILARIAAYQTVADQIELRGSAPVEPTATALPPLSARITQSAEVAGLQLRRLEPEQDRFRVTLEDAEFARVILWLADMEAASAVTVAMAELERQAEPGVVSARLLLGGLP